MRGDGGGEGGWGGMREGSNSMHAGCRGARPGEASMGDTRRAERRPGEVSMSSCVWGIRAVPSASEGNVS